MTLIDTKNPVLYLNFRGYKDYSQKVSLSIASNNTSYRLQLAITYSISNFLQYFNTTKHAVQTSDEFREFQPTILRNVQESIYIYTWDLNLENRLNGSFKFNLSSKFN